MPVCERTQHICAGGRRHQGARARGQEEATAGGLAASHPGHVPNPAGAVEQPCFDHNQRFDQPTEPESFH